MDAEISAAVDIADGDERAAAFIIAEPAFVL
jgi:hypothetical protein